MRAAAALLAAVFLASAFAGPAGAQTLDVTPAKDCNARTAKPAEPGDVAADPAAFAGKCVKLEGWWRDIGFYPTRSEAAVPDALSIPLLDNRRLGLYLPRKRLDAAPQGPKLATVVGTVGGACSNLPATVTAADTGYCHYKAGGYLAVATIEIAK
ncbi:hypothetical protein [uncultured Phenylobacterium sp.]|uniref:hypothetical protein n=1 Tax=uncultured Phenylobacterium sp. TaxID=349273 RepID=UPI0025D6C115|nr:hypothetical protein [uncultured Phenylobacterium sp.]